MGARPPAGREIVVERVLDQRVRERVPARHVGFGEHRRGDRPVAQVDDGVFVELGDASEHVGVEVAADDRGQRERALCVAAPRRATRRPITSRMLTGRPDARRSALAIQRPSSSW